MKGFKSHVNSHEKTLVIWEQIWLWIVPQFAPPARQTARSPAKICPRYTISSKRNSITPIYISQHPSNFRRIFQSLIAILSINSSRCYRLSIHQFRMYGHRCSRNADPFVSHGFYEQALHNPDYSVDYGFHPGYRGVWGGRAPTFPGHRGRELLG